MPVATIRWTGRSVRIIDQTQLPVKLVYLDCRNVDTLWHAIKALKVRGAPALGIAAAFGVILGIQTFKGKSTEALIQTSIEHTNSGVNISQKTTESLMEISALAREMNELLGKAADSSDEPGRMQPALPSSVRLQLENN